MQIGQSPFLERARSTARLEAGYPNPLVRNVRCLDQVPAQRQASTSPAEQPLTLLAEAAEAANRWHVTEWEGAGLRSLLLLALSASRWVEANQVCNHIAQHADPRVSWLCLPDLIEARVYGGHLPVAHDLLERLEQLTTQVDSMYLTGVAARARALLGEDPEGTFRASIDALDGPAHAVEQARSRLLFGEWLRLRRQPGGAARELTLARDALLQRGCFGFAARASRGLAAATSAFSHPNDLLTFQEREVATRAAAGHTNVEIARSLFLSRHTIDYHLRKVFQKLGISSRRELKDVLTDPQTPTPLS